MSNVLKNVPAKPSNDYDIMSDIRYIRRSCSLVTEALKKGCDVLQMPNGDVVITEIRTVSFQYTWNDAKSKFEKVKSGSRLRKLRRSQKLLAQQAETKFFPEKVAANTAALKAQAAPARKRQQRVLEEEVAG